MKTCPDQHLAGCIHDFGTDALAGQGDDGLHRVTSMVGWDAHARSIGAAGAVARDVIVVVSFCGKMCWHGHLGPGWSHCASPRRRDS